MPRIRVKVEVRPAFMELFSKEAARFNVVVAHRRAGKTVAALQKLVVAALSPPLPDARYGFVAPYRVQAKLIAWTYLKRFTEDIMGSVANEAELRVDLPTGARVQLYGADNPQAIRGGYFDGVVLDEYSQMDPVTWDEVVRPMLSDRQGWATFIGTFRGKNAFWKLFGMAGVTEGWKQYKLKASETGIIPELELDALKASMSREAYAQEYECDATANLKGAYYAELMAEARAAGRITRVPYDPVMPTYTAWDLGVRDATAIWIVQVSPAGALHAIDYIESSGVGLDWYIDQLRSKPYKYTRHIAPQDIAVVELGTGRSRFEVAQGLGINFDVAKTHRVLDGVEAVRVLLPRMWFDAELCGRGIEALEQYRKEWDGKLQAFRASPLHDWTSHCADSMRYFAMSDAPDTSGLGYNPPRDTRLNLTGSAHFTSQPRHDGYSRGRR